MASFGLLCFAIILVRGATSYQQQNCSIVSVPLVEISPVHMKMKDGTILFETACIVGMNLHGPVLVWL